MFAVEYLPGQFDQRADSAAQCIQLISQKERPIIKTARVYVIGGAISDDDLTKIKKYVINPIESREASLAIPATLAMNCASPNKVSVITDFPSLDVRGLADLSRSLGLAMDAADIAFCQQYFKNSGRAPTITEIRMIDTY